jgi:uncharacterized protein (DUF362 family)
MSTKVALVNCSDHADGSSRALELLGVNPVKGKSVALKANCNTADPFPASTHPDTLSAFVAALKKMGATRIVLAERSGPANTEQVLVEKGIFKMGKEMGFEVINLDNAAESDWVHFRRQDGHWSQGFKIARLFAEAECAVQTCCLKTHNFGGHFTLSMKNTVGMVERSYMSELHSSKFQRQMIAEINEAYSPSLILMDGIDVFVNGGPMRGDLEHAGVMVAGTDRVAVDAVGVAILRSLGTTPEVAAGKVFQQDQIARAVEIGLGIKTPKDIKFLTCDAEGKKLAKKLTKILAA